MHPLLIPTRLSEVLDAEVIAADVEQRRADPGAPELIWIRPRYRSPGGPARLLLKVGGRDGDVVLFTAVGSALPAPVVHDVGYVDGVPYRLTEVAPGEPLSERAELPRLLAAVRALARAHRQPLRDLPARDATAWLWRQAAEAWPAYRQAYRPPEAERFEALLARPPLDAPARVGPVVLCHGDAHPGNALIAEVPPGSDRGEPVAQWIDWEDWRVGPGAEDVAFLLSDLPPDQRRAWAPAAVAEYADAVGRPHGQVCDELAAALDQLPKMLPFWFALDATHEAVTGGLARTWATWADGLDGLGLTGSG